MENPPIWIEAFAEPIRDTPLAQVAFAGLIGLIMLDIVLGTCAAIKDGRVKSSIMREGVWHKTGELGIVGVGVMLDGMVDGGLDIGYSAPVCTSLIVLLALNEAVSCMENAVALNPKLKENRAWAILESVTHADGTAINA